MIYQDRFKLIKCMKLGKAKLETTYSGHVLRSLVLRARDVFLLELLGFPLFRLVFFELGALCEVSLLLLD